jgi:hypothetical protein
VRWYIVKKWPLTNNHHKDHQHLFHPLWRCFLKSDMQFTICKMKASAIKKITKIMLKSWRASWKEEDEHLSWRISGLILISNPYIY